MDFFKDQIRWGINYTPCANTMQNFKEMGTATSEIKPGGGGTPYIFDRGCGAKGPRTLPYGMDRRGSKWYPMVGKIQNIVIDKIT